MAAIRLEDLLQAQQDLNKKDEKQRVESMSVEDFRLMSKELSDSKDSRTTKSIIKKGMIDKTGDGLNSNVIKMVQVLKEATKTKGNVIGPTTPGTTPGTTPATKPKQLASPESDRLATASKEGAGKYVNTENTQKGGFAFLKDELKKLGTLEGYFDTEKASEGFFGNMVKRKANDNKIAADVKKSQDQFVGDQMAINPNMAGLKQFGGDKDKVAEYWKGKWQEQQEVLKKQAANENQIEGLQSRGYNEKEIARGGFMKKRRDLDDDRAGVDKRYDKTRSADRAALVSTPTAATLLDPTSTPSGIAAEFSTNETEAEAMRASSEQLSILSAIELNTREFKEALLGISKGAASAVAPEAGGGGGGITDVIGGGLKRAGGAIMKGARGLGTAMVNNPKLLGRLGSVAAVAAGGYTAYKKFTEAEEQKQSSIAEVDQAVAEGKITPVEASTMKAKVTDESNIAKGTAVGEGTGMAAGGIAGMKVGATIGTMIGGPVGTVAGIAIGGAVGAVAGSTVGKKVGGSIISGYQSARNFFGGSGDSPDKSGPAAAGPAKKIGPNYTNSLRDYESSTPVGYLEAKYPGINAKFLELAKKFPPKSDSLTMIQIHEKRLEMMAIKMLRNKASNSDGNVPVRVNGEQVGTIGDGGIVADKGKEGILQGAQEKSRDMVAKATPVSTGPQRTPAMLATSAKIKKEGVLIKAQDDKLHSEATKLGIDPYKAKAKIEGGQLTEITDTTTGKSYPIAVDPSKQSRVDAARSTRAAIDNSVRNAPTPQSADAVYGRSGENAAAATKPVPAPSAPVVINAPTNVSNTSNMAVKSPVRNTESSYKAYDRSRFAY